MTITADAGLVYVCLNCGQRQDEPPLAVSHRDYVSSGSVSFKESSNLNAGVSVQAAPSIKIGGGFGGSVGFKESSNLNAGVSVRAPSA